MNIKLPLATAALATLILTGCTKHTETAAATANTQPAARVAVAPVTAETLPLLTEVTGTIRPVQRAILAAKVMGTIEAFPVSLGQRVAAGDVLVQISAGEINAKVLQARSQLNQVSRDLARERDLLTKGASTTDMVSNLEDRLAMTQAQVREAEIMLGYATIRAPFAGVITRKPADTGNLASPGLPLLEMEGDGTYEIEAGVPDSLVTRLAPGTIVTVSGPNDTATFPATLIELSPAADPVTRTAPAKFSVPAGSAVRSGQFVRIQLPGKPIAALLVPTTAVSLVGQLERVFVVGADKHAVLRLVKSGARYGDRVEILSGLSAGESVVLNPPTGLREGRALEVTP
jgi:membrane fusion protein, multidrug efflux system